MKFDVIIVFCLFLRRQIYCQNDNDVETTTQPEKFCRERNKRIGNQKSDLYNVVEASLGEIIKLQCHFCGEIDDGHPKNWYKLDRMDDSKLYEVKLDMENNMTLNRVHVNLYHTLTIHNVTEKDVGEYFCKGLDNQESDYKYNYFIDVILPTEILPEKGNLSQWKMYHDEQFSPINTLFKISSAPEYRYFKESMKITLEIVTEWDNSGSCIICGRPKGEGRKQKKGHCKLKVTSSVNITKIKPKNYHEKLLLRASHLSCRSKTLQHLAPGLFNMTSIVPDFIEEQKCDGVCNPDADGIYKGWKSTKKHGFKFKKTFVLAENAHLTIICPESTLENIVVWKVNGHVIKPGESVEPPSSNVEPRVTVDTFNTLYLYGVTKDEEGNYTCHVDDIRMQQVRVFVVSKAKLLTQAFVRHMMYLAFMLSLTLSCYCAGLVITWTRRKKFKTYQEVRQELKKANKLDYDDEEEALLAYTDDETGRSVPSTHMETPKEVKKEIHSDADISISSGSNMVDKNKNNLNAGSRKISIKEDNFRFKNSLAQKYEVD